jgi:hypothetical protein
MKQLPNLGLIRNILKEKFLLTKKEQFNYSVPILWSSYKVKKSRHRTIKVNPYKYFLDFFNYITKVKPAKIQKTKRGLK